MLNEIWEIAGEAAWAALQETAIVISSQPAQKHTFSTRFRVRNSAGLRGWGAERERWGRGGSGNEGKKTERHKEGWRPKERRSEMWKEARGRDWQREEQRQKVERNSEYSERERPGESMQVQEMERKQARDAGWAPVP